MRKAAVNGLFYPDSCSSLKSQIRNFNLSFDRINIDPKVRTIVPQAVIVPHAGYIYSGFTANFAYKFLAEYPCKRIIVIGPSHRHYFKGISGSFYDTFETPCQLLKVDKSYLEALSKIFDIGFEPKAHLKEHSTEVQMPLIQHYFPKHKVIELIYGEVSEKELAKVIIALLNNPDNAVVISSDLSHYYPLRKAKELDAFCMKALRELDEKILTVGCEACGYTGIKAMILAAKYHKMRVELLDYKTSAKASGDESSVVGYLSTMFYR